MAKNADEQIARYSITSTGPSQDGNCKLLGSSFSKTFVTIEARSARMSAADAKIMTHQINLSRVGIRTSRLQTEPLSSKDRGMTLSAEYNIRCGSLDPPKKEAFLNSKLNHPGQRRVRLVCQRTNPQKSYHSMNLNSATSATCQLPFMRIRTQTFLIESSKELTSRDQQRLVTSFWR